MKTIVKIMSIWCICFSIFSCDVEIDPLKEFTNGKEIRYPGKPLELVYLAGRNRLEIQFKLGPDPNIENAVIYWNGKRNKEEIDIDRSQLVDNVVAKLIENLPENVYSFEVQTIDKFGNYSVPEYLIGQTYGNRYESFLIGRQILSSEYANVQGDVLINWGDSIIGSSGVELKYTTVENETRELFIPNKENGTVFTDVDKSKPLEHRTVFYPEQNAIDVFHSEMKEYSIQLPAETELKKPYASYFVEGLESEPPIRNPKLLDTYYPKRKLIQ